MKKLLRPLAERSARLSLVRALVCTLIRAVELW